MEQPKIVIDDSFTINVYICYLLEKFSRLSEKQLEIIVSETGSVNLFDFMSALNVVESKNFVVKEQIKNETYYTLSDKGKSISESFYTSIPLSIREQSVNIGTELIKTEEMERSVICKIVTDKDNNDFLTVTFLNEMGGANIMELKIFAPSPQIAKEMQKKFLLHYTDIIQHIMEMFT